MTSPIDAAHVAPGTTAQTTLADRKQTLNSFLNQNYITLTAATYEAHPGLLFYDCERILSTLANGIERYGGPANERDFLIWAERFVRQDAERTEITVRLLRDYRKIIFRAIHENMWSSAEDCAVSAEDVFSEVALLIYQRAHSLAGKGRARTSTRLYGLAKKHCYLAHSAKNSRRLKAVRRRVQAGGRLQCEYLSDTELASMRTDSASYDSGYAECSLLLE